MTSELEDIILTIDTREQNQKRIKAVEDYFTGHGAIVEHSALKHCDYRLIGEFRGVGVNLGVEAKGWDNFLSDSIDEMEEKLLLATEEYEHVGFFVETQNYTFTPDENNSHGKLNYSIPKLNKNLPAKTLASFEGMLDTISKHPQIHVRQLRSEAQFPYSLYDLLVYLQNPHVIKARKGVYKPYLLNLYMQITGVGLVRANKLTEQYPNPFWLCSASEESLKAVLGKATGQKAYDFIHCHDLETDEWRQGYHKDGIEKDEPVCDYADPKMRAECKTKDNFKHSSHSGTHSTNTTTKPGDPQSLPPKMNKSEEKQERFPNFSSPAETDIGLDGKPLDCVVKCRACYQVITEQDNDESGFCHDLDCIKARKEPSLENKLRIFLREPHTVEEIVEKYGCSTGYTFQVCMANVKSGNIKKVTEQYGRVTFQRIT